MKQHRFGQIHLPDGPHFDSPTLQLSAQLTVVVAQAPLQHHPFLFQGCQFPDCRLDAFHGQGGVDNVAEQDEAFRTVSLQKSSQPSHRVVENTQWHQLPSGPAHPSLAEVQVCDSQASTAWKPSGPACIELDIVVEVEPVGGHGGDSLAGGGVSDEEGQFTHPRF